MATEQVEETGTSSSEVDVDEGDIDKDVLFEILQNSRRRRVIQYLWGRETPTDIRELTQHIAAEENGVSVDELEYQQRKRVHTSLYQNHLPKLADVGFVDYDRRAGKVSIAEPATTCQRYLDDRPVPSDDISWEQFYLGLAVLSTAAVALAWGGVSPFSLVDGLVYAGVTAVALLLIAVTHYLRVRTQSRSATAS